MRLCEFVRPIIFLERRSAGNRDLQREVDSIGSISGTSQPSKFLVHGMRIVAFERSCVGEFHRAAEFEALTARRNIESDPRLRAFTLMFDLHLHHKETATHHVHPYVLRFDSSTV